MSNSKSYWVLAALLLAVGAVLIITKESNTGEYYKDIFNSEFTAYPDVISGASRSDASANQELVDIMAFYEKGDYGQASALMTKFLKSHPKEQQLKLYRGICYLEMNETAKAEQDFKDIILFNEELADQAEWYLALTYLKAENLNDAREYFTRIANKKNSYSEKAVATLEGLKEGKADAMLKIYEVNDGGKFMFFYPSETNPAPHLVTDRTLYLEASRKGIIPSDVSYNDFVKLSVPEQQDMLKSGQEDAYASVGPETKDLFEKAMALLPKPSIPAPEAETPQELAAIPAGEIEVSTEVAIADANPEAQLEGKPAEQPKKNEKDLPWIFDVMLRADSGTEVEGDPVVQENSNQEIPALVGVLTNTASN